MTPPYPISPFPWLAAFPGRWLRSAADPVVASGAWPPFADTAAGHRASDADTRARIVGLTGGMVAEALL